LKLALAEPTRSPRELAVRFTDTERYFVSEASAYRILKAQDLITSPAFIFMKDVTVTLAMALQAAVHFCQPHKAAQRPRV
jgi:ABC-type phosphonate transport system ATPase subunit